MRHATLGPLGQVSRLTLGGGGIGQIWGEVSADEAKATLTAALDGGIDVLDAAPGYRNCEAFIGEVFDGRLPAGVKVTTKHGLGTVPVGEAAQRLTDSLAASLAALRCRGSTSSSCTPTSRPTGSSTPTAPTVRLRWRPPGRSTPQRWCQRWNA